jgi:hypothetical protein
MEAAMRAIGTGILMLLAVTATAEIHPGTIAFDYRNSPAWEEMVDYEWAVLSPRATAAADSLGRRDVKVVFWVQVPFVCTWDGSIVRGFEYDNNRADAIESWDAVLRDTLGFWADVDDGDIRGCYALDLRDTAFVDHLAWSTLGDLSKGDAIIFDYGCAGIKWISQLNDVDPSIWIEWEEGYRFYRETLRELLPDKVFFSQCDSWRGLDFITDGLVLEKIGWSLTPIEKAWRLSSMDDTFDVLLASTDNRNTRSLIAAIALIQDDLFNWGFPANRKAPEFFELDLGKVGKRDYWERKPGVFQRHWTHGIVIANTTDSPAKFGSRWVAPKSGLVIQTKNHTTGRYQKWLTNEGR